MPVRLIDSLTTTALLADIFSDASVLRAMVRFEVALAQVEGQLGIIPAGAAETIHQAATTEKFNVASLASATLFSATPAIPFVKQLTEQVRNVDPIAAGFVHWGATSQDLCDTAMILLLREAQAIFAADIQRLETQL